MKKYITDKTIVLSLIIILNLLILPFVMSPGLNYRNYLLALLLAASNLYFYYQLKKEPAPDQPTLTMADWLGLICILVVSGFLGMRQLHENSFWLDEYEELRNIVNSLDLLRRAAAYQQPPLSYFFRKWGIIFGGKTELGLRISSVIGNTLFLIVMYLNIRRLTRDSFYSLLSTLLLAFNYWVILYSVEGRPYSISLFYFAVFLYFLISEVKRPSTTKFINFGLIFATLFWLLSISMQPLIFICLAAAGGLLSWLVSRNLKILKITFALVVALLLYLPFLWLILKYSQGYLQTSSRSIAEYFQAILRDLYMVKTMYFNNYFYHFISLQMLILIVLSLFTAKRYRLRLQAPAIFSIIYFLLIILLFEFKIKWFMTERYYITTVPLFYLLFSTAFFYYSKINSLIFKKAVVGQLLIIALVSYLYAKPFQYVGRNWRGLYSEIDKRTTSSAKAFIFSYTTSHGWSDEYFIASEMYKTYKVIFPPDEYFMFPTFTNNDYLYNEFANDNSTSDFYFVINDFAFRKSVFEKIQIEYTDKFTFPGFFIIKAIPPKSLIVFTKEFYSQLEIVADDDSIKLRAYDGLFLVALFEKNCENLKKYLSKYSELAEKKAEFLERTKLHNKRYLSRCLQKN